MRGWLGWVGLITGAFAGAAGADEIVTIKEEVSVVGAPWTMVQTQAGDIEVRGGGPEGRVLVEARKRAPTRAEATALGVDVTYKNGVVRIVHAKEAKDALPRRSVSFIVQVPTPSRLQLVTSGGSIEVDGTTGGVAANTSGGKITVRGTHGEMNLQTSAGAITADRVEGSLEARTSGGAVNASGKLRGPSTLSTSGGSIEVKLPPDSRVHVEAVTTGGAASNDFGLPSDGHRFSGNLGDGRDGSLLFRTSGGNIALHKL